MVTIDFGETSDFSKKISWIYKQHHYWYTHSKWQFFKALEYIVNNKGLKAGARGGGGRFTRKNILKDSYCL